MVKAKKLINKAYLKHIGLADAKEEINQDMENERQKKKASRAAAAAERKKGADLESTRSSNRLKGQGGLPPHHSHQDFNRLHSPPSGTAAVSAAPAAASSHVARGTANHGQKGMADNQPVSPPSGTEAEAASQSSVAPGTALDRIPSFDEVVEERRQKMADSLGASAAATNSKVS